jgi:hypothetical protein
MAYCLKETLKNTQMLFWFIAYAPITETAPALALMKRRAVSTTYGV